MVYKLQVFFLWILSLVLATSFMTVRDFLGGAEEFRNPIYIISVSYFTFRILWLAILIATVPLLRVIPKFERLHIRALLIFLLSSFLLRYIFKRPDLVQTPLEISGFLLGLGLLFIISILIAKRMSSIHHEGVHRID